MLRIACFLGRLSGFLTCFENGWACSRDSLFPEFLMMRSAWMRISRSCKGYVFHKLWPCDHFHAQRPVFQNRWVTFVRALLRRSHGLWPLFRCSEFLKTTDFSCHTLDRSCDARKNCKVLSVKVTRKDLCRDFLSTDTQFIADVFSTNGGMLAKLPTAPWNLTSFSTPAAAARNAW